MQTGISINVTPSDRRRLDALGLNHTTPHEAEIALPMANGVIMLREGAA